MAQNIQQTNAVNLEHSNIYFHIHAIRILCVKWKNQLELELRILFENVCDVFEFFFISRVCAQHKSIKNVIQSKSVYLLLKSIGFFQLDFCFMNQFVYLKYKI